MRTLRIQEEISMRRNGRRLKSSAMTPKPGQRPPGAPNVQRTAAERAVHSHSGAPVNPRPHTRTTIPKASTDEKDRTP